MNDLPAAAVARFRRDLEALTGTAPDIDRRLALAVSGGPDSLALLALAAAAYSPQTLVAATVDHKLRPDSTKEARAVAAHCARLEIEHHVLDLSWINVTGNLQERAREERYLALAFWAGDGTLRFSKPWRSEWVATAHQQDDLAETFLMRARRGAGVGGLAAMRAVRQIASIAPEVPDLVRPLLGWSRAELADIVRTQGMTPVEDPSNIDPAFDRSRIRALLAASPDLPSDRLARAATNLRDAENALIWLADREWDARSKIIDYEIVELDPSGLPNEIIRRLVEQAVIYIHFEMGIRIDWDGRGVDALVERLQRGEDGTLADVMARAGPIWMFAPAPPRRDRR